MFVQYKLGLYRVIFNLVQHKKHFVQHLFIMSTPTPVSASVPPETFTIADVAAQTGILKNTLRAWERRYGYPVPVRDRSGERRYGADDLQRLLWVKRLLDLGERPGRVVTLSPQVLEQRFAERRAVAAKWPTPAAPRRPLWVTPRAEPPPLNWPQWLSWMQAGALDAMRQALDAALLKLGLVSVVDDVLGPLAQRVGMGWASGELTISHEHLYSEAVARFLQDTLRAAERLAPPQHAPRVLLTTLPGDQHTLGLLMAECLLALEGCERLSLGREAPLGDVVQAALDWKVDVVLLSVSACITTFEARTRLTQLATQLRPKVALWVGGSNPALTGRGVPEGIQVAPRVAALSDWVSAWRQQTAQASGLAPGADLSPAGVTPL